MAKERISRRKFLNVAVWVAGSAALSSCGGSDGGGQSTTPRGGRAVATGEVPGGGESEPVIFASTQDLQKMYGALGLQLPEASQLESEVGKQAVTVYEEPWSEAHKTQTREPWKICKTQAALATGEPVDYFYKYRSDISAAEMAAYEQHLQNQATLLRRSAQLAGVDERLLSEYAEVVRRADPLSPGVEVPMLRMRSAGPSIDQMIRAKKITPAELPAFLEKVFTQAKVIYDETGFFHNDISQLNVRVFKNPHTGTYEPILVDWTGYRAYRPNSTVINAFASRMGRLINGLGVEVQPLIAQGKTVEYRAVLIRLKQINDQRGGPTGIREFAKPGKEWIITGKPELGQPKLNTVEIMGGIAEAGLTVASLVVAGMEIRTLLEDARQNGSAIHWDINLVTLSDMHSKVDPVWQKQLDQLVQHKQGGNNPNESMQLVGALLFTSDWLQILNVSSLTEGQKKPFIVYDNIGSDPNSGVDAVWNSTVDVTRQNGQIVFLNQQGNPLQDGEMVLFAGSNIVGPDGQYGEVLWQAQYRQNIALTNGDVVSGIMPVQYLAAAPY